MEDAAQRVTPLERGDDVQQGDRREPHRRGDGEPVFVLGPGDDRERSDRQQQAGEAEPCPERRDDDRLLRRPGTALHQSGARRVEPEPEGEQHVDGEVDPQDLQRQQR